ncbi:MAG: ATP-binding protein [Chlamydiales bacterium]|nr:ATP-binding protein [Chlamydiales bacterium]
MNRQFVASMDNLRDMIAFIVKNAKGLGFEGDCLSQIELAAEEALVNVISYSYMGMDRGKVDIECSSPDRNLKITIIDHGAPFNPVAKGQGFDPEAALTSGAEGGFGIFLMTKMVDEVSYHHNDGANVLTLLKKRPS